MVKLRTLECRDLLKKYEAKDKVEEMAVKVLIAISEDYGDMPNVDGIEDLRMVDVVRAIEGIKNSIGIEMGA